MVAALLLPVPVLPLEPELLEALADPPPPPPPPHPALMIVVIASATKALRPGLTALQIRASCRTLPCRQ